MRNSNYVKECQGCHKMFKRNGSRKRHIMECKHVPDELRREYANARNFTEAPSPTLSKKARAALLEARMLERKAAREKVSAAKIRSSERVAA